MGQRLFILHMWLFIAGIGALAVVGCSSLRRMTLTAARPAAVPTGPAPTYRWSGDDFGSGHSRDIMVYTPPARRWSTPGAGPSTVAHETLHGMQRARSAAGPDKYRTLHGMQRARSAAGPDKYRYFYFEQGRGIYVPEPRVGLRPLRRDASGGTVRLLRARAPKSPAAATPRSRPGC